MKVSTEIANNFGYEKITQLVDNIPLTLTGNSTRRNKSTLTNILKYSVYHVTDLANEIVRKPHHNIKIYVFKNR